MYGKVKLLRVRGKRLSDREIAQAAPVEGLLRLAGHSWAMERVVTVTRVDDNVSPPLVPPLAEPKITAMHNGGMLLEGIERPDGDKGAAYVQEWSIRIERE